MNGIVEGFTGSISIRHFYPVDPAEILEILSNFVRLCTRSRHGMRAIPLPCRNPKAPVVFSPFSPFIKGGMHASIRG
jgi:hypothetical protein